MIKSPSVITPVALKNKHSFHQTNKIGADLLVPSIQLDIKSQARFKPILLESILRYFPPIFLPSLPLCLFSFEFSVAFSSILFQLG